MLVEHTFVTTYDADTAMQMVLTFLETLDFRIETATASEIKAVRGREQATAYKVDKLPQSVQVTFDRGRVNVAAGIMPREGKERPVHAELMTALVLGLERMLVQRKSGEEAAAEWYDVQRRAGRLWHAKDKVLLIVLLVMLAIIVIAISVAVSRF